MLHSSLCVLIMPLRNLNFFPRMSRCIFMAITASTAQIEFDKQLSQVKECIHFGIDSLIGRLRESQAFIGCNFTVSPEFSSSINHVDDR